MPQQKFGRYEVVAEIGQGAMGRVYKGFDPLTQRHVAIKAIKDEILAQDEKGDYVKRFQREARAAGGLSHPNIITIFDVGENYFVMEYLEGKNLLAILAERGPLSLEETLEIVSPVAGALAYAHSKGVYHRDIKPANIMVFPDNRPVITDFGLAHLESTVMTTAGQFLGSPSYMSPEQIIGEEITPRADLFSLSVVTYEMLTGQKPFPGENITTVVYRVVHSAPIPPHQVNPALPEEYEDIFAVALAKKPEDRFASFSELVSALNLKEFDRLSLPKKKVESMADSTVVSLVPDDAPGDGFEQETLALSARRVESESSATSRKRTEGGKSGGALGIALVVAAALALAVGGIFWMAPDAAPLALSVQTDPEGAEVFIDDAPVGVSPVALSPVTEGEHVVRVTKAGFLPLEETVSISGGARPEPLVLALQPARISLFVESIPPGALVSIDGAEAGKTPLEDFEVDPGQHEVQVEQNGYEVWRSAVAAQAGESVNLVARLRSSAPAPASRTKDAVAPKTQAGQLVELGPDDKPAKRISGDAPSYPPAARRRDQQGRVTVEFVLTEDGVPTDLTILESAGEILDNAVLESVATWRYEPAEKDGVRVRVKMRVRQTFRLGGS
jgi:serine/threonine-protein kinase